MMEEQSEAVTHQNNNNNNSNTHIYDSTSTSTHNTKYNDTAAHSTKEHKEASTLDEIENVTASDSNFQRKNSPSGKLQYSQDDRTESTKFHDKRGIWEARSKGVASEDNTSQTNHLQRKDSAPGKLRQDLLDMAASVVGKNADSTGDDTSHTNHLQRKGSGPGKLRQDLLDMAASVVGKNADSTGDDTSHTNHLQRKGSGPGTLNPQLMRATGGVVTESTKSGIGMSEKSKVLNEILFNDYNTKAPGALPPPPPPLPPCNSSYMMQRVTSKTTGDDNLNTPIISAPYEQQKPDIIRIYNEENAPVQVNIFVKAGGTKIIEIHTIVHTDGKSTARPRIQSKNEDIISDNCSTDSAGSDSGYDALSGVSGSASDFSC